ncbi:MAG: hypothetical protein WBE72_05840 [Terracidiphilus sp.]
MNDLLEDLGLLSSRVEALEKRVFDLEHPAAAEAAPAEQLSAAQLPIAPAAPQAAEESATEQTSRVFAVLGKGMFGIAGAYVLRAVAEHTLVPRQAIAAIAIVYAVAWLVWAARARALAPFARAIYAGISALILAPMMWELTLRFHALPPLVAAGVLAGYTATAAVVAWEGDRAPVFWVAHCAAALTALALSIVTHEAIPFIAALLVMVLVCEYAAAHDRGRLIRPLVEAVTDAAIWTLLFIYASPQGSRTDYPLLGIAALLAPGCVLFLINAAGIAFKTVMLRQKMAAFETVQAMIGFVLAAAGLLLFEPGTGAAILDVACLVLAAACYTAAFVLFRKAAEPRNFRVFATWGAALFLAGVLRSLPSDWAAACLGLAALAAIVLGVRQQWIALDFHGVTFLAAAGLASGLPVFVSSALVGSPQGKPAWSLFAVSALAVFCYAAGNERAGETWKQQVLHFVPALVAVCSVAALLIRAILRLAALFFTPDVFHVALVRTLTLCAIALVLAFGGSRWRRLEMTRLAYGALAFVAAKLLFEDLRHGRMEFIAASIFLFAVTLIGVPRLARMGGKT